MSYLAYLCYRKTEDDEDEAVTVKFVEPRRWEYDKVIAIQFSPLHSWSDKDKELYQCLL